MDGITIRVYHKVTATRRDGETKRRNTDREREGEGVGERDREKSSCAAAHERQPRWQLKGGVILIMRVPVAQCATGSPRCP